MAKARTAKQRAALRKAQLASARKRRGKGKGKLAKANRSATRSRRMAAVATGGLALAAAGIAGAYYAKSRKPKSNYFGKYTGSTVVGQNKSKTGSRRSGASLSRSKAGSLTVTQGTRRTRQRNRRRRNPSLSGVMNSGMSTKAVLRALNNPNYVWDL